MKRKIWSVVLTIFVLMQTMVIPMAADASTVPASECEFTFGEASGKAGETVTVPVSVVSTVGAMTLQLSEPTYNTEVLEFVGFTGTDTELAGKALLGGQFDNEKQVALLALMKLDGSGNVLPSEVVNGKICDIAFKIKDGAAPGEYPVSFTCGAIGDGSADLTVQVNAGKVIVRPTGTAEFTFGTVKGLPNATVDVPLRVKATEYVSYLYLNTLTYDSEKLEFLGFFNTDTGIISTYPTVYEKFDKDSGVICIIFQEPQLLDGAVCDLRFTIKDGTAAGDYPVTMTASARYISRTETTETIAVIDEEFYDGDEKTITVKAPSTGPWSYLFWTDYTDDSGKIQFNGFSNTTNTNVTSSIDGEGSVDAGAKEVRLVYPAQFVTSGRVFTLKVKAVGDGDSATITMKLTAGVPDAETTTNVTAGAVHVHGLTKVEAVPADCTHTGVTEAYWHCEGCNTDYADEAATTEVDASARTISALGHSWGEPSYEWATDYSKVTAKKVCANNNAHEDTEEVVPTSVTTPATCTTGESTTYTATFTKDGFTEQTKTVTDDPLGHSWGAPTYNWATDNSKVTATRVCARDASHIETETVDTTIGSTDATCTVAGTTTYTATFTNPAFAEQTNTVPGEPLGHAWGEVIYTWETDNSKVTASRTCTRTGCTAHEEETVDTVAATTNATCTADGKTVYTATFTNEGFAEQTREVKIDKLGHNMTEHAAVPATCTTAGNTAYWSCDRCNKFFSDAEGNTEIAENSWVIGALGHDWGEPTYTWETDNSKVTAKRVCKTDNTHEETEPVNTTSVTTDPTCTADGKTVYTATFTNEGFAEQTREVKIDKLGHNMTEHAAVPATCTTAGNTAYWSCDRCNKFFSDAEGNTEIAENSWVIGAPGHTWGDVEYTWADDNSTVTAKRVCTTDPTHEDTETVNTVTQSSNATCTASGTTVITATFTNPDFEQQTKETTADPLGHSLTKHAAKAAKCETEGSKEYWECSRCHKYFEDEAGTKEIKKDSWIIPALGHDWDEGTVLKEATKYWEGRIKYTCKNDPSHTKEEAIPKLGGDDVNSKWTFIANLLRKMAEDRARQNSQTEKPDDTTKPEETGWKNPFRDVSENDSFYEAVKFVNENGLFLGVAADRFSPEGTMTRAMFVTVLGRLAGVDVSEYKTTSFSDVETGLWYSEYVEWAAEQGIILGYGDGTFGPEKLVTREQAVLIIQRYVKMCGIAADPSDYDLKIEDAADVSEWALDAVKWACENDIYVLDGGLLKARQPSSRANVAQILLNLVEMLAD